MDLQLQQRWQKRMKLKEVMLKLLQTVDKEICFPLHDKPVFVSEACKTNDKFICMLDTGYRFLSASD